MKHPVVILHGWGLSADRYDGLISELRKQHLTTYALDFPADEKKPLTLSDFVTFLHAFLEKHKIKKSVLIGHSFGGRVALKYQWEHPGEISALILTGTPGFSSIKKKIFIPIAKFGKFFLPSDRLRTWYYNLVGAREYNKAQGAMKETFKNIVSEDLVQYMKAVRMPTLLVWGREDRITPLWIAYKMQKTIQGATLKILEGDHGVSYKDPKKFVGAIYDFLFSLS